MKKTSKDTRAAEKTIDYFQIMRTADPIESYGIKEFQKRMEAERKKKSQKQKVGMAMINAASTGYEKPVLEVKDIVALAQLVPL